MLSAIAAVVSIAVSLAMAGVTIYQTAVSVNNQNVRNAISSLTSAINDQISKNRLSVNKLISLLQSRNSNALMNYLQNNPVISKNMQGIQKDSDLIAQIQAEQTSLENEISSLQSELTGLGYSQTISGANDESTKAGRVAAKLRDATKRYSQLKTKASGVSNSTTNPINIVTSDIDARSQNINGGYQNK